MNVELRPRTFGENLSLCFSLGFAHFVKLFAISVLFTSPLILYTLLILNGAFGNVFQTPSDVLIWMSLPVLFLTLILTPLASAASILIVAGSFTGNRPTLGQCFSVALSRMLPLIGVNFMVAIVIMLGAVLLIIPAFIFLTWFWMSSVVLVLERVGPTEAMGRSRELSSGYRWQIFGTIFVLGILQNVVDRVIQAFVPDTANIELQMILPWVFATAVGIFMTIAPVVWYFHQRTVRESYDVEQLASLVDQIGGQDGSSPSSN